jgi:AmiR/NasT family two-component response regulator
VTPPVLRCARGFRRCTSESSTLAAPPIAMVHGRATLPPFLSLTGSGEVGGDSANGCHSRIARFAPFVLPRAGKVLAMNDELHLRVLIANEKRERLELLAQVVAGLGHDVIAREIYVKEVGAVTAREHPDVALVGLGLSSDHALELITEIVREASCPVIALLSAKDPAYVHQAARRGVFAYIVDGDAAELQSAIDITLQRFAEYQSLQGAFGRRALIEQAKGILMARHSLDADHAFDMLRNHSQHNGHKVVDVAQAIVDSHLLLLPSLPEPPTTAER